MSSHNNNNNNSANKDGAENPPAPASTSGPTLELKPLKNVIPIIPAQQVDCSSPPSGQVSSGSPNNASVGHDVDPDNDETGVENITQVHPLTMLVWRAEHMFDRSLFHLMPNTHVIIALLCFLVKSMLEESERILWVSSCRLLHSTKERYVQTIDPPTKKSGRLFVVRQKCQRCFT